MVHGRAKEKKRKITKEKKQKQYIGQDIYLFFP